MGRIIRKADDGVTVKLDQTQLVAVSIGLVLMSALIFLIGVLVGRMLFGSPDHRPGGISTLVTPPSERIEGEVEKPVEEPEEVRKVDMTFYGGSEEKEARPPKVKAEKTVEKVVAKKEIPQAREKATQVEPKIEQSPEKIAKTVPKPSEKPKAAAAVFTIQLNSFKDRALAERMVRTLSGSGVKASVVHAKAYGEDWYRVQSGSFSTRSEAEKFKEELAQRGIKGYVTGR